MKESTYEWLKFIAQIILPAVATLCFTIGSIWGLPYGEQIVGTITAIDAFLGTILKIDSNKYYKLKNDPDGVGVFEGDYEE